MPRYKFLLIGLLALFLGVVPTSTAGIQVLRIYDGDTLTLVTEERVRLVQIDTPELSPAQCYGIEARDVLRELIGSSDISLVKEAVAGDKDSKKRLLRYVIVDSKNLNLELVKRGVAAPWFYKGQKGKYSKELMEAAQSAKKNKIGLWKACPATILDPSKAIDTGPIIAAVKPSSSSEKRDIVPKTITPGAFCSSDQAGRTGVSTKGLEYICKVSNTEQRLRWRQD
jgi:micrococcal nuclease